MTYQETLDYLFNSLPMYHRIGKAAYKADITNTVRLMEHLGQPERQFRSIHVAGTNGKGSCSHMLAAILQQAGYKVGLYTSPHLVDFRERIRINGQMIPQDEVTRFVEQHRGFMEQLQLSFFEMTVGLAFDYFARERVDVAVVEVGMGGRLDSTNVITPDLSVITNIGLEHTQFLGDTLAKIAFEKAGIIKPGVPVVVGESHPDTRPVFEQKAAECQSLVTFADDHFAVMEQPLKPSLADTSLHFALQPLSKPSTDFVRFLGTPNRYTCQLSGSYQLRNIATVLQALCQLQAAGYSFQPEHVRQGIAQVVSLTGLHGRWELLATEPVTICETAHNADGVNAMLRKLAQLSYRHLHIVYGCVNDKDFRAILSMLPRQNASYYYTMPSVPRQLPYLQLADAAAELGMAGPSFATVGQAIEAARAAADPGQDLVLVTGSIFLVADALACQLQGDVGLE